MLNALLIAALVLLVVVIVLQWLLLQRAGRDTQHDNAARLDQLAAESARLPQLVRDEAERQAKRQDDSAHALREQLAAADRAAREEQARTAKQQREELAGKFESFGTTMKRDIESLGKHQHQRLADVSERVEKLTEASDKKADTLRLAVEKKLDQLQQSNDQKLEKMRQTVDEKLQTTLDKRLGESFKLVSERLEKVQRGLGEMQELATGVGDLKRVMTNVKTRGTFGEFTLESIITQSLTPDQYEKECCIRPETSERVDFAIKIPGDHGTHTLLPIDSKFPAEDFDRLQSATDPKQAEDARKALDRTVLGFAKDLTTKYLYEPVTTPHLVLFVPTEGLYAELINRPHLFEAFGQMRVMLAGPTTLMATLHTVRVMYRNQAIQKHAQEIGQMLGVVKDEFGRFEVVAQKMQEKLESTARDFNTKIGRRARAMGRALKTIDAGADHSPIAQLMKLEVDESADETPGDADDDASRESQASAT